MLFHGLGIVSAMAGPPADDVRGELVPEAASAPEPRKRAGLRFDVSFPHWFSDEYQSGPQARSGSFGLGYRPADWFIEIYGRWEWSYLSVHPSHPDAAALDGRWIDFTNVGLAFVYPIHAGRQHVRISATALAVIPNIAGAAPSLGFSGGFSTYLTWDIGRALELGPFFELRENTFRLRRPDGTLTDRQVDAHVNVGIAVVI